MATYCCRYMYPGVYIYMGGSQIAPRHLRSVVHQARWRLWILCVSSLSTLAPARDFLDCLWGSWPGISVYNVFVFYILFRKSD